MILADPINCTIPSMDALKIKGQEITCTTSLIDSAKGVELIWIAIGAIGAFGAMFITLFMARYAWKAWNTAQDQLELTREISLEQQRLPALADFIKALRLLVFVDTSASTEKEARKLAREASLHAELWTISYKKIFDSGVIQSIIAGLENDVIWCYRVMAEEHESNQIPGMSPMILAIIGSVGESNKLFNIVRKTAYDLHRGHATEDEALERLESGLNDFAEYVKGKK